MTLDTVSSHSIDLRGDRDNLFDTPSAPIPFEFNKDVAQVFDDMVSRSVPMYEDVTKAVVEWAGEVYQPGTNIYDLGCSTGTTIGAMCADFSRHNKFGRFVGIDNSQAMLSKAEAKLLPWLAEHEIVLKTDDIQFTSIYNASTVIMNYTLQFVQVEDRLQVMKNIYDGLNPGGILILAEKVASESVLLNRKQIKLYETFKQKQGYSRTEIERKKEALDNVLVPLTLENQMDMIKAAGFAHVEPVYKWNNFVTLIAEKS
jgi:tRNA (cmo5U34)-methyltransferase